MQFKSRHADLAIVLVRRMMMGARSLIAVSMLAIGFVACSADSITGEAGLPSGVSDPEIIKTPDGALRMYRGTLATIPAVQNCVIPTAGLLSDELQYGSGVGSPIGIFSTAFYSYIDSHLMPERELTSTNCYGNVQSIRTQARQGVGLLTDYPSTGSSALIGHLRALEAYAEVLLAELYCSGIPLSTVDYNGNYTLRPGISTTAILQHALTLADSAVAMSTDSLRILNFARIIRGRVLLGLGEYARAAEAVNGVPDTYVYEVKHSTTNFANAPTASWSYTVGDKKGVNGLDYVTSGDPRTRTILLGRNTYSWPYNYPAKYNRNGSTLLRIADGIEARLIEAEAKLHSPEDVTGWLAKINHLRATAITPALADTTDPGTPAARIDLMFRERASWLFLTGRRHGDMRRLVRNYDRDPSTVFPTGTYPGGSGAYGYDAAMPPAPDEYQYNPHYKGCLSRNS